MMTKKELRLAKRDLLNELYNIRLDEKELNRKERSAIWATISDLSDSSFEKIKVNFLGSDRGSLDLNSWCLEEFENDIKLNLIEYHEKCKEMAKLQNYFDSYYNSNKHKEFIKQCVKNKTFQSELVSCNRKLLDS